MDTNKAIQNREAASAYVESLRKELASKATDISVDRLDTLVNAIAEAEGQLTVWARVALLQANGQPNTEILGHLFELLAQGADDGWSGRGNDMKRAQFEGVCQAAKSLSYKLQS